MACVHALSDSLDDVEMATAQGAAWHRSWRRTPDPTGLQEFQIPILHTDQRQDVTEAPVVLFLHDVGEDPVLVIGFLEVVMNHRACCVRLRSTARVKIHVGEHFRRLDGL